MNANMAYFTTSFGDRIPLLPDYEQYLYPKANVSPEEFERRYKKSCSNQFLAENLGKPIKLHNTLNDIGTFALTLDLLDQHNILSPEGFRRALDIGGAEGVHAALLRGNYARQVEVVDIRDGTDPDFTSKLRKELSKRYRKLQLVEALNGREDYLGRLFRARYPNAWIPRLTPTKHLNVASYKNYYNFSFKRTPMVDRFIVGDWRKSVDGLYDFIMNFQCLWLWNHKTLYADIFNMLETKGVFVTYAPYHWAGRPSLDSGGLLGGAFPFFEQRLTREDIKRYYHCYKPQLEHLVDMAYDATDSARPTLRMHVDSAKKAGLRLIGYNRIYHRQNYALVSSEAGGRLFSPATSADKLTAPTTDIDSILHNIHQFRSDVGVEDLHTRAVIMAFIKQ